jgi:hypothetical protein
MKYDSVSSLGWTKTESRKNEFSFQYHIVDTKTMEVGVTLNHVLSLASVRLRFCRFLLRILADSPVVLTKILSSFNYCTRIIS